MVIGGESLHSSSNDNGTRLVDFCAANQLVIGGTLFQHRDIHKGTWRSPNGLTVNQIDHICISRRFCHSLIDVKVCRGADIGSDHYLVRGRLKIKLQSVAKINATRPDVPAIERLRNMTKVEEYNVTLQNRFECLDSEVDLESMWDNFKQTISDVSMEVLGRRPRKIKEQHLSQKTKDLLVQRGQFKRRDPNSDANRSAYSKLNKLVKKSSKVDDNNWAIRVATDLEEAASKVSNEKFGLRSRRSLGKVRRDRLHLLGTRVVGLSRILTTRKTGGRSTSLSSSILHYQVLTLLTLMVCQVNPVLTIFPVLMDHLPETRLVIP